IDVSGRHERSFGVEAKLRGLALPASVGPSPEAGPDVDQRAGAPHAPTDRTILVQEAESPEEIGPVVLAAADQRQLLGAGVLDVDGDVPEVLGNPPQRDHGGVAIPAPPEV